MFTILYCSQVCFTRQFGVNFCTNEHSVLCLSASVLSAVNAQNYAMHVHIFTFRLFSSLICHSVSHWRTVNARRQIKRQAIARTQRLFQCVCVCLWSLSSLCTFWLRWYPANFAASCFHSHRRFCTKQSKIIPTTTIHSWECRKRKEYTVAKCGRARFHS